MTNKDLTPRDLTLAEKRAAIIWWDFLDPDYSDALKEQNFKGKEPSKVQIYSLWIHIVVLQK